MTSIWKSEAARAYFQDFERLAQTLPADRKNLLREQLESHLIEALPATATESDIARELKKLGSPGDVIGEELRFLAVRPRGNRWKSVRVVVRVLGWILAIVFGVGFVIGLIALALGYRFGEWIMIALAVLTLMGCSVLYVGKPKQTDA